jgi:hypothetical protein
MFFQWCTKPILFGCFAQCGDKHVLRPCGSVVHLDRYVVSKGYGTVLMARAHDDPALRHCEGSW